VLKVVALVQAQEELRVSASQGELVFSFLLYILQEQV